jgi:hypothetical protein
MKRMKLPTFGKLLILVSLADNALLMSPALRAQNDASSVQLKKLEIDCVIPGSAVSMGPGTCTGDLVGKAQIVDVATFGTTLGNTNQGQVCFLEASTDTLTTNDGSTIMFTTTGMTCFSAATGINTRNNAYQITNGTGRFSGVGGVGTFVVAPSSPTTFAVHISGNIQFRD